MGASCWRSSAGQAGASLVEVLVAIVIFAIGGLMVLTMTTTSLRVNGDSRANDQSVNLARKKMETLMALNYNSPLLQDVNADGTAGLQSETAVAADYSETSGPYLVAWNVAEDAPVNGAKILAVISSWTGSRGNRRVVFQTIISEP